MFKLFAKRMLLTIPTLLGVMVVALLLVELMPGDPAAIMAGERATPEAVELIRRDLDLDRPIAERFYKYVTNVLQGDLGTTPGSSIRVSDRITAALPVTLSLAAVALAISITVGSAAGVIAALRQGRFLDRAITAVASLLLAVPSFVLGLALVTFFAINRSWLPAVGYDPPSDGLWNWFSHLILPGVALAMASAAELARVTRGAFVDTMEHDYIRAARAKGTNAWRVVFKHAAKNAATPIVTVAGLQISRILGSALVVEQIFGMNGFGTLAVNAVFARDMVLIQGVVLVSSIAVLVTNLFVDLSYGYFNPASRA